MNTITTIKSPIRELKLVKIGNSTGVIIPREVLAQLRVSQGDMLYLSEAPLGINLSPRDPDFIEGMEAAEEIMRDDRDILAVLSR